MNELAKTISVTEASALLGFSKSYTVRLAKSGKLGVSFKADGLRGIYLLDRKSVESLATERGNK